jgi:sugar/nucleoside kinase (ribokinase family)
VYWETQIDCEELTDVRDDEVIVNGWNELAGGSCVNFTMTCKSFSLKPRVFVPVGTDPFGELIQNDLRVNRVPFEPIRLEGSSGRSIVIKKGTRTGFLSYPGVNSKLGVSDIHAVNKALESDVLLFLSGVPKLIAAWRELPTLVKRVHEAKGLVALDHGRLPRNLSSELRALLGELAKLCDFYFPNEKEILRITSSRNIRDAVNKSTVLFPSSLVVIKQGDKGCTLVHDGESKHFRTLPVRERKITAGAGDTFDAAFLWSFHVLGQEPSRACKFANMVARARVQGKFDWGALWKG